jgi:hypothetical protein
VRKKTNFLLVIASHGAAVRCVQQRHKTANIFRLAAQALHRPDIGDSLQSKTKKTWQFLPK